MTSFQLFKGLTDIDSELLESIEQLDFRNRKRIPAKRILLIAAIIALKYRLGFCSAKKAPMRKAHGSGTIFCRINTFRPYRGSEQRLQDSLPSCPQQGTRW